MLTLNKMYLPSRGIKEDATPGLFPSCMLARLIDWLHSIRFSWCIDWLIDWLIDSLLDWFGWLLISGLCTTTHSHNIKKAAQRWKNVNSVLFRQKVENLRSFGWLSDWLIDWLVGWSFSADDIYEVLFQPYFMRILKRQNVSHGEWQILFQDVYQFVSWTDDGAHSIPLGFMANLRKSATAMVSEVRGRYSGGGQRPVVFEEIRQGVAAVLWHLAARSPALSQCGHFVAGAAGVCRTEKGRTTWNRFGGCFCRLVLLGALLGGLYLLKCLFSPQFGCENEDSECIAYKSAVNQSINQSIELINQSIESISV